jgi:hypothetical protein
MVGPGIASGLRQSSWIIIVTPSLVRKVDSQDLVRSTLPATGLDRDSVQIPEAGGKVSAEEPRPEMSSSKGAQRSINETMDSILLLEAGSSPKTPDWKLVH